MKIYNKNNDLVLDLEVDDSSFAQRSIMGDRTLTLNYSLTEHVEIPLGAWCEFKDSKYFLFRPENFKKNGKRNFEYTLSLETEQSLLRNFKFKSTVDIPPKLKFSLTGSPEIFLTLLVFNLNDTDSGWSVGSFLEAEEVTLDFNNQSCMEALGTIADAFKTEWDITSKTISLGKVEKNVDTPISLSYGEGEGLLPGLGRTNYDNSTAITRLYVIGGDRNIDKQTYGAESLLLPKNTIIQYKERVYKTNEYGTYLERVDVVSDNIIEGSIDLSNIYPKWESVATNVIAVNDSEALYDFVDSNIPDSLDFNNYLPPQGETKAFITFQNGLLAGKSFDINKYDHTEKRFELVPIEESFQKLPQSPLIPAIGNKYGVFEIKLPEYYIQLASNTMLEEAARYMYENEDPRYTFNGELDRIYAKQNWNEIGGYLDVGYFISFTDQQFQTEPILIRITGIKEYVNDPYAPILELSNVSVKNTFGNKMAEIGNSEVAGDRKQKDNYEFTKRRWRDAKETQQNMFDVLTNYFSDSITPLTVETMQVLIGNPALQFIFLETKNSDTEIDPGINWVDDENKMYVLSTTWLKHMTLGINYMGGQPAKNEYRYWNMPAWHSGALAEIDDDKIFFLYAVCSKTEEKGKYILSTQQIKMDSDPIDYYFLVGILNTKFDNLRSYADLYGFTEILPGQITGRRFQSTDGYQFWDFTKKQFQIGDQSTGIDWNVRNSNKLTIRGGLIQDPGGNPDGMTVWRGDWSYYSTYYLGNEIAYDGGTYRYVNSVSTYGNYPTNKSYWKEMSSSAADAKLVTVTSDSQVFKYANEYTGSPTPSIIRLNATVQNIPSPTYQWYYGSGNGAWYPISGAYNSYYDLSPSSNFYTNNATTIRCLVSGVYSDQVTIVKLADGSSGYTVLLTNEAHSVSCDVNGNALPGELGSSGKAKTKVLVYKGTKQLTYRSFNSFGDYFGYSIAGIENITYDSINGELYITSIDPSASSGKLNLLVRCGEDFDSDTYKNGIPKVFSISKSKQGTKGEKGQDGINGAKGSKGDQGPTICYRGIYNINPKTNQPEVMTYYGNNIRRDIVKKSKDESIWYITQNRSNSDDGTSGSFSGINTGNQEYWKEFGANFESVATGFLFTTEALIAGWNFNNEMIWSQNDNMGLDGRMDSDVRFWSGKNYANRSNAPTRIYGNGQLYTEKLIAKGAEIQGKFESNVNGDKLIIDPSTPEKIVLKNSAGFSAGSIGFFEETGYTHGGMYLCFLSPTGSEISKSSISGYRFRIINYTTGRILEISLSDFGSAEVIFPNLPTSPSKLRSGQLWRNGNAVNIVP